MIVPPVRTLANVTLAQLEPSAAVDVVHGLASGPRGADVHLVNAYTLALADADPHLMRVLNRATLNLPDGKPIVWFSYLLPGPRLHQVRGPQLFLDALAERATDHSRHYLLGGSTQLLSKLESEIALRIPQAVVVGSHSPPFRTLRPAEREAQDLLIRESGATIVWVGLGTPKQDFEAARIAESLGIVAVAVGAAFDFAAGTKAHAPRWMSTLGLEWFFRLLTEPRRLWRRYLLGNPRFIWSVVKNIHSR